MFNKDYWINRHSQGYAKASWKDSPSPFALFAKKYIPTKGKLLELGAGIGQDGIWFAEQGLEVTQTEFGEEGLHYAEKRVKAEKIRNIKIMKLDMTCTYPFADSSFDIVYAHSCIQYFTEANTRKVFKEINRVLKPGGILAVLVNSINDLEYGNGPKISEDYFEIKGLQKRYYSEQTLKSYIDDLFKVIMIDSKGETHKDQEVGNHGMIRLIACKQ